MSNDKAIVIKPTTSYGYERPKVDLLIGDKLYIHQYSKTFLAVSFDRDIMNYFLIDRECTKPLIRIKAKSRKVT